MSRSRILVAMATAATGAAAALGNAVGYSAPTPTVSVSRKPNQQIHRRIPGGHRFKTLCGHGATSTPNPDKVTCERCRAMRATT